MMLVKALPANSLMVPFLLISLTERSLLDFVGWRLFKCAIY